MKPPYSVRIQQDLIQALDSLRDLLPLAERYLSGAPSDPANAKLEDARALLNEYGPSTGESTNASRQRVEGSPGMEGRGTQATSAGAVPAPSAKGLTAKEKAAVREAIAMRLSGEMDDDVDVSALKRALEKL